MTDKLTKETLQNAIKLVWDLAGKPTPKIEIVSPSDYERKVKK